VRPPLLRASFDGELVIDGFAGGGGASTGIEQSLGRPVDIAINHDPVAISMHKANHPGTRHYCESIFEVNPREACGGRRVGFAWFSPDCTHHSRAKGTKPLDNARRGLAWVVVDWAREVKPRVIAVENVEEFEGWGPLGDDDRPDKSRAGETFREWVAALQACGYEVQWRRLVAADFGAPTTRRRLFVVARSDGLPIVWPVPTHGRGRAEAWRTAAEVIDWSLAAPSIFERKRPLAEATLQRIAKGLERYVFTNGDPFLFPVTHQGAPRVHDINEPVRTVTAAHRGELALVEPFVVRHGHYSTITGAGLREGCGAGTFRGQQLRIPLATVCATNDKHLVAPILTKHYGGVVGHGVERPLGTITGKDHHALTSAFLTKFYGTSTGSDVRAPVPTVTGQGLHLAEVRAFLLKYYGSEGKPQTQDLFDPVHTITTKARFGLVMVHGQPYQLVDIGLRMLAPHELFAAQGFPAEYVLDPEHLGKPLNKTQQTALAGNSVCPQVAAAVVGANVGGARAAA
jgi:DNA (cytosine-5)-methyltransferase 1